MCEDVGRREAAGHGGGVRKPWSLALFLSRSCPPQRGFSPLCPSDLYPFDKVIIYRV